MSKNGGIVGKKLTFDLNLNMSRLSISFQIAGVAAVVTSLFSTNLLQNQTVATYQDSLADILSYCSVLKILEHINLLKAVKVFG